MKLVVGSGPTGVAVATALLDAGQDVTLLDAGVDREAGVDQQLARFQTQAPEQWDRDWLAGIRSQPLASQGGVPEKRAFGSAHVYSLPDGPASISLDGVGCGPSFARGGFSNVWGAVTLPYRDADISEWPIDSSDLAADYAAVFEHLLPLAAVEDRLADLFPLHARAPAHLQMSAQAQAVLGDLEAGAAALAAAGVHFGRSRLAVESGTNRHGRNCVRCGLCMHGCPYELIYNARDSLVQLQGRPGFTYQPDFIVDT
ncbi:MAG: hypothetical protein KJO38_06985, partial [Gammaproteobacteria bacterium]|nr:hypothetical protein [Gammaproteobacteria bacterium]